MTDNPQEPALDPDVEAPSDEDPWPNQQDVVDGVTPVAEVSQDPDLFADDDLGDEDEEDQA